MILYLDTTALMKLFVRDEETPVVQAQLEAVDGVATSRVTFPEACEALARRREEGRLSFGELSQLKQRLGDTWGSLAVIDLDERQVADLSLRHGLRGLAGAHVAAALALKERVPTVPVIFCSFDERQSQAAVLEGLAVMNQ